jgi:hypothetical protein
VTYQALIQYAFRPEYWACRRPIYTKDGCFTQLEANFSLFFGLAIQLYESTLVSCHSRFERFVAGDDCALTNAEKFGFEVFTGPGRCTICHAGPTFSDAVVPQVLGEENTAGKLAVSFPIGGGRFIAADIGFLNIGVRQTLEDLGIGGADPYGDPLSFSQQLSQGDLKDRFLGVTPGTSGAPVPLGAFLQVRGAFKVPSLLNVEYTAPYMHDGGFLTLEQVVEFYARGGNFPKANGPDFTPIIAPIPLLLGHPERIHAVADFLRSLTDPACVDERAPFDHPSLLLPDGAYGDTYAASWKDRVQCVPAVGCRGRCAYHLPPIRRFLEEEACRPCGPTTLRSPRD